MAKKFVDARHLACPQPVMLTVQAMAEADEVTTLVDNETARENVTRLAESRGCRVTVETKSDGTYLTLQKVAAPKVEGEAIPAHGVVLFISSDILGRGENRELGSLLMQSFLHTLGGLNNRPETIIMINNGVKLAIEGSLVLGELQQLESHGIEILACGTCLSRLQLTDKVRVGQISNMFVIANSLLAANKIVPL